MFEEGEVNITRLARITNIKYDRLLEVVQLLEQKGLVEVIRGDKSKLVRLNYSNPKVIILKNLFEELENI